MKQRRSLETTALTVLRPLLRILVFPVLIGQIRRGSCGYVYLCILTLMLFEVPGWAERHLRVRIPAAMECMILLFVFSSEILGEIRACYVRIPWWDAALHGGSGFLFAAVGFVLPELLDRRGRESGSACLILGAVCFSMTVGVLWEFLEWGFDWLFGLDMQKDTVISALYSVQLDPQAENRIRAVTGIRDTVAVLADGSRWRLDVGGYLDVGLHDTMGDLLANLTGAGVFAWIAGKKGSPASHFIPQVIDHPEEQ